MKKYKPCAFMTGFTKVTGIPMTLPFFKPKVYYENKDAQSKKLPKPCILMSNHKSLLDFPLYLTLFPFRTIRFLMAEVLFAKSPIFSWLLFKWGAIYVNRDTKDFYFVGESVRALEKGETIGVFPEGRLPVGGKPFPFKPGIIYIALRTDAPIVPVYTDGCYGTTKRARVLIGDKIYIKDYFDPTAPEKEEIARLTKLLEERSLEMGRRLEKIKALEKKRPMGDINEQDKIKKEEYSSADI